jgi:uncharacterized membrane protein YoaK (UPF0700 family)
LSALRKIHGGLAHLFAILLPIQFFLAGLGAFTTIHNKKFDDNNFGPHGALGSLLGLIAILIVLLALAGRWSSRVTKLSAALFVAMLVQTILGVSGAGTAPILGGLHVVNALVVVAIAYLLVKSVRQPTDTGRPDRVVEAPA